MVVEVVPATRAKVLSALEVAAWEEEEAEVVVLATMVKDPSASLVEAAQVTRAMDHPLLEEVAVEVVHPVLEVCPFNSRPSQSPGHRRLNTSSACRRDSRIKKAQDANMHHISFSIKFKNIYSILLSSSLEFFCSALQLTRAPGVMYQ